MALRNIDRRTDADIEMKEYEWKTAEMKKDTTGRLRLHTVPFITNHMWPSMTTSNSKIHSLQHLFDKVYSSSRFYRNDQALIELILVFFESRINDKRDEISLLGHLSVLRKSCTVQGQGTVLTLGRYYRP